MGGSPVHGLAVGTKQWIHTLLLPGTPGDSYESNAEWLPRCAMSARNGHSIDHRNRTRARGPAPADGKPSFKAFSRALGVQYILPAHVQACPCAHKKHSHPFSRFLYRGV